MINDSFQVNETIKGFYIFEQDGKIVAKGHNMIVNDGRKFLFDVFASKVGITVNDPSYADYSFYRLYAGKQLPINMVTIASTTLDSIINEKITKSGSGEDDERFYRSFDNGELGNTPITTTANQFCLNVEFTGQSYAQCISSFFITFAKIEDGDIVPDTETLFSRFVIDPIYLVSGSSYSLKYYISF